MVSVWFGDQVGWVTSNLVFRDGIDPSRIWLEGWVEPSSLLGCEDQEGWHGCHFATVNSTISGDHLSSSLYSFFPISSSHELKLQSELLILIMLKSLLQLVCENANEWIGWLYRRVEEWTNHKMNTNSIIGRITKGKRQPIFLPRFTCLSAR